MLYILICGPQVMTKLQLFTADCVLYMLVCGPQVMAKLQLFTADCMLYMLVCGPQVMAKLQLFMADCVVYIGLWSSGDGRPSYSCLQQTVCCTCWSVVLG